MKILLAIDNSRFSEAATQSLISQVRPDRAEVRVIHIIEVYPLYPSSRRSGPDLAVASEEHRHQAEALVARSAQALRDAGFHVTTNVEQGDPKVVVLDTAEKWNADLVMLGSHGEKNWTRFLMGSVSDAVVRHAPCSVQVVRIRAES